MGNKKSSLKSTIAVSLTNYLDAGAIVAGASGLSLWQSYLGLTEGHLGFLNAISANCLGAAIGAIIGGFLADKYGRKAIYTYNMLVYMVGVLLVVFTTSFPDAPRRIPRYWNQRGRGRSGFMDVYLGEFGNKEPRP